MASIKLFAKLDPGYVHYGVWIEKLQLLLVLIDVPKIFILNRRPPDIDWAIWVLPPVGWSSGIPMAVI